MEPQLRIAYAAIGNVSAFPASVVRAVQSRGLALLKSLHRNIHEIPYIIGSFEEMEKAIGEIKVACVDVILLNICTWVEAGISIRLIRELRNSGVILWSFAEGHELLPLSALIEVTSTITKLGYKHMALVGSPDLQSTKEDLLSCINVFDTIRTVSDARIGLIGYNSPGMVDSTPDEISVRKYFGTEIVHLDLSEVIGNLELVKDSEVSRRSSDLIASVGKCEVSEEDVTSSVKLYFALNEIALTHRLSAIAIRCWPELKGNRARLNATPCYGLSQLTNKGVIGTCEADVSSAITMLLMKGLSGCLPVVLDYNTLNEHDNTLTFWHCGAHASDIIVDMRNITLRHPSEGGLNEVKEGLALECSLPEGAATLAKVSRECNKMIIAGTRFIKPVRGFRGGIAEGIMDNGAKKFVETVVKEGIEHHICAVYKDIKKDLVLIAKLLDIDVVSM